MFPRHQLAAYSPITARSAFDAAVGAFGISEDSLSRFLCAEYDATQIALTASGTHALQLGILAALSNESGGNRVVALPAFGCFDLATAAIATRARVSFYDVDPTNLSPDWASLEGALREGARAVVVAEFYGVPVDWQEAEALSRKYGATLVEDAAQGHGASWRGRTLGSLGVLSVLSFNRGKGWTAGSGGALLSRGGIELQQPQGRANSPRNAFVICAQWLLARPAIYGLPRALPFLGLGETHFALPTPAERMALSARRALMANSDAAGRESMVRRKNARYYLERLEGSKATALKAPEGSEQGHIRLPVRIPGGMKAFESLRSAEALGIAPSYPRILPTLSPFNATDLRSRRFPGAEQLVEELVTLPTHSRMQPREIDQVLSLILEALEG